MISDSSDGREMKKNAYYYEIKNDESFTARVLSCEEVKGVPEGLSLSEKAGKSPLYAVTLDKEGFYPEGGGQSADKGRIGEAELLTVREYLTVVEACRPEELKAQFGEEQSEERLPILHYLSEPLTVGQEYICRLDWDFRKRNSQNHSGEHIISGLINQRFSYQNVGFHMNMEEGEDAGMTIDFDGELSWEDLMEIERKANRIVRENREIRAYYPEESELPALHYRSKKELSGDVRLVEIPGADLCACCGTHVERTGEIGVIKLLSLVRHRGGSRVWMLCGDLAVADYERKQEAAVQAAQLLSVPISGLASAVEKQKAELKEKDFRIGLLNEKLFSAKAELYREKYRGEKLLIDFIEGFNPVELRKYCDYLRKHTEAECIAVFLPKEESGEFFYVFGSESRDIREAGKRFNMISHGRGGGQSSMLQGTVRGEEESIREFVREAFL